METGSNTRSGRQQQRQSESGNRDWSLLSSSSTVVGCVGVSRKTLRRSQKLIMGVCAFDCSANKERDAFSLVMRYFCCCFLSCTVNE